MAMYMVYDVGLQETYTDVISGTGYAHISDALSCAS